MSSYFLYNLYNKKACTLNCKSCTNSKDCSECMPSYNLHTVITPYKCYEICPDYFYGDSGFCKRIFPSLKGVKIECTNSCLKCTTSTNCQKCEVGLFVDNTNPLLSVCTAKCPVLTFPSQNTFFCERIFYMLCDFIYSVFESMLSMFKFNTMRGMS